MKVSVVIATKNRKEELHRAISSVVRQTEPTEIVVLDDGSTDGTSDMVRSKFPHIRLDRTASSLGYVVQRNRGAVLCSGDVIFSIDDDAEFTSSRIIEQTVAGFCHPRVAAIAIPYVEPWNSGKRSQNAPNGNAIWVTDAFRGTSYAVRRQVFLGLGGFRDQIVHQGEEMDFCIRLLNLGFIVRLGIGDSILHYEVPQRDRRRMDFYGRRNDILFAWQNVPMPYFPVHLLATTFNGFIYALRSRRPSSMMAGILSGYFDMCLNRHWRQPVSRSSYRLQRALKKRGPKTMDDIETLLPPLSSLGPKSVWTSADHICTEET
jgi:glycosyltransferase involved in cell wall biosynthesis